MYRRACCGAASLCTRLGSSRVSSSLLAQHLNQAVKSANQCSSSRPNPRINATSARLSSTHSILTTMSGLKDKIVLITGASSGIGEGTAVHMASLGCRLALVARNKERLEAVAKRCVEAGAADAAIFVHDLSKPEECVDAVKETVGKFGALDVLVNSAGILVGGATADLSLEDYERCMAINTTAAFVLTKESIPHLIKTKGNIVHVSSVTGLRAFPGVIAYNMSKAAVDQLTRCSALEVADKGVRINSVNPGVIVTELHKTGGMDDEKYTNFLEHSKTTHALGRAGEVREVAETIIFLASDGASYITGQTLPVDGGRSVMCPR